MKVKRVIKFSRRARYFFLFSIGVMFIFAYLNPWGAQAANWYHTGWLYRQKIIIDSNHTDFSLSGDLSDFPVLIQITSSTNPLFGRAQPDGDDILFTDSDGITKIPHDIEYYNDASGVERLDAWVKIPTFYSGTDTVIYMYYGNASAMNQQDPENVWDSDFKGVWHLDEQVPDEQTTGKHYDSTSLSHDGNQNGNEGKAPGATPAPKIGGAQSFDGTNDLINVDNVDSDEWTGLTESAWAYPTGYTSDPRIICKADSGTPDTHIFSLTLDETSATTGRLRVRLNTDNALGNPTGYAQFMGTYVTGVDKWYYIVFTWNSSTSDAIMYVYADGALQERIVNSKAGVTIADAQVVHDVIIGNVSLDDSRWWLGNLDEIRLSSAPRSDDWIKAEYFNQHDPGKYQSSEEEIFITGTVYSDEGVTNIGSGKSVALAINGGSISGTGVTDTDGRYEITIPTSSIAAGNSIIVFLDGGAEKGAAVTVSDGERLSGLDIYKDHVIVRHDSGGNLSNTLMGTAHNGDGDIPFSYSVPHITIANGVALLVQSGETFQQNGNVTVGSTAASDLKIHGSWEASDTLAVKGNLSGSGSLNGANASVDIDGSITVNTYTATTGTTFVGGDWNVANFTHSSGTVVFDGTGTVTGDTFYTLQVNAPGFTRTATGDLTVVDQLILTAGTFSPGSGNHSVIGNWNDTGVSFQPLSGTIILTSSNPSISQGGTNHFSNIELTDGATLSTTIDVNGDLTIISGTLDSTGNTIELAGSWDNSGSFSAGLPIPLGRDS